MALWLGYIGPRQISGAGSGFGVWWFCPPNPALAGNVNSLGVSWKHNHMKFDPKQSWYHGSPLELSVLRVGSTVTQKRELARIFSHKPTIVSVSDDGQIRHNGTISGYLYIITDEIQAKDVIPHPQTTMSDGDEWLTTCELHLRFLCTSDVMPAEQLTDDDYAMLRDKLSERE